MRTGLSTIQQTLTPEAASVLNQSIAEASRRNHGQTTPLHVAATLLSSPSGFLRQACIKSHPNSSHPLQCRALELCFSVALERLPTSQNTNGNNGNNGVVDPPISNALMAALKRAQAHQRRGCPEQQQQPLLAVKVELEHLIISILDDPGVSRVMREASFSSPAVKSTIEQSLINSGNNSSPSSACNAPPAVAVAVPSSIVGGLGYRPVPVPVPSPVSINSNRNMYLNPRLREGGGLGGQPVGQSRSDEVSRVLDILLRTKKRNPVLVGDSEPEMVVREVLARIEESKQIGNLVKNVKVIRLERELDRARIVNKIVELGAKIGTLLLDACGGVVIDLGDLKWMVEQSAAGGGGGGVVLEVGKVAMVEMGKVLEKYGEGIGSKKVVWLIGTATCETYLRCQVYYPSMENDWDLQAVPIAARNPLPGLFPRLGNNGILGSPMETLSPLKSLPTVTANPPPRRLSENLDPAVQKINCCPQCLQNYEQELARLVIDKPSPEAKSDSGQPPLPQWLRNAKSQDADNTKSSDQTMNKDLRKEKTLELQKKWQDLCLHIHPGYHQLNNGPERTICTPPALSMTSMLNPKLLSRQVPMNPKLQSNSNLSVSSAIQLNPNLLPAQQPVRTVSHPGSLVRTDLVLGRPRVTETTVEGDREDRMTRDFLSVGPADSPNKSNDLHANKPFDTDSFKKLLKGILEKVWWQREAASAVATTVTQCKVGNGKRRGTGSKGDIWLLFTGPDSVGKRKMASALSELVCGTNPITISLGSHRGERDSDQTFRGKTALDQIAEAVRRNPFSVIMLENIDEADLLLRGRIKQAMDRGRLADSYGREISLSNIIFILTSNWLPENLNFPSHGNSSLDEKKLADLASGGWQLKLSLLEKTSKRRAIRFQDCERPIKPRKDSALSFDLNEAADADYDLAADGSRNSSDLTTEHEDAQTKAPTTNRLLLPTTPSLPREFLNSVDESILFKPVDFEPICREISNSITKKFTAIIGNTMHVEVEEEAMEKIVGGVWLGRTSLEEWSEKVLVPSLNQIKSRLLTSVTDESMVVRLDLDGNSGSRRQGDWLPSSIKLV